MVPDLRFSGQMTLACLSDKRPGKKSINMNQGYGEEKTQLHKEGVMTLWICLNTPLEVWLLNANMFI